MVIAEVLTGVNRRAWTRWDQKTVMLNSGESSEKEWVVYGNGGERGKNSDKGS